VRDVSHLFSHLDQKATTLRAQYMPLRPDLDEFLFATLGEERNGMPLSVVSALTGLGLDPWAEATRLSSLEKGEAVKQLVLMIARLPGERWASSDIRKTAVSLIERLPSARGAAVAPDSRSQPSAEPAPSKMIFWLVCFLLATVALACIAANGGLPFVGDRQSEPASQTEAPVHSN